MSIINVFKDITGKDCSLSFRCPGCGRSHNLYYQDTPSTFIGPRWTWNLDKDKPVLTPSILASGDYAGRRYVCHSFVGCNGAQPGEIIFLSDCTHDKAGTVQVLRPYQEIDDPEDDVE